MPDFLYAIALLRDYVWGGIAVVVADQPVFVSLMEASLARQPDLEVVAQAGSLTEARRNAAEVSFDVAVLDLGLPDGNGADLISDLRGLNGRLYYITCRCADRLEGKRQVLERLPSLREPIAGPYEVALGV